MPDGILSSAISSEYSNSIRDVYVFGPWTTLLLRYFEIDFEDVRASLVIHNRVDGRKPSLDTEITEVLSIQPLPTVTFRIIRIAGKWIVAITLCANLVIVPTPHADTSILCGSANNSAARLSAAIFDFQIHVCPLPFCLFSFLEFQHVVL